MANPNPGPQDYPIMWPTPEEEKLMMEYTSGAKRDHVEEARYDLIPLPALKRLALIYAEGAEKYGEGNWRKGLPVSDIINHAVEHARLYRAGDKSEDHLAKVAWAVFTLMTQRDLLGLDNASSEDKADSKPDSSL